ncbi:MAG: tetratricopeptide repeat protein [Bacteroidetes bacterium]|nr:tetratricopeptide repeat protein [Bacteroidota bacterium]
MKINKKYTILLFVLIAIHSLFAQTPVVDSLKKLSTANVNDTLKMHAYAELTYEYLSIDIDSAKMFANLGIKKYSNNKNKLLLSDLYAALGTAYGYERDFDNSLVNFNKSLAILKTTKDKTAISKTYFNIGLIYYYTAKYDLAIQQYIEALKLLESIKDTQTLPNIYNGLSGMYKEIRNYDEALNYGQKALKLFSQNKDSVGMASALNNVGNVYDYQNKLDEALDNYRKSMRMKELIKMERGMSSTLNNIGIILSKKDSVLQALEYYNKALSFSSVNSDKISQAVSYDGIGMVYYKMKQYDKALSFLEKSIAISTDIDSKLDIVSTYEKIALCYAAKGNYKKAFDYQQLLFATKDSIFNVESSRQVNELATQYETEKKQLLIDNLNKDNALKQEELAKSELQVKQQNMQIMFFILAVLLLSILSFFIFRSYKQKKQSAEIILSQKEEVERQRDLVEEKSKEITDSIHYAKRIQQALLASDTFLKKHIADYFIFYKPKDIVSGDFYWANVIDGKFVLITADCTGHGVPGAFMSLLNISYLNEAIIEKRMDAPDKILDYVRSQIIQSLNPEGSENEGRDGMDATLCIYDFKGMWLRFSAANNPLWLYRNNEIKEFSADKMPVGMYHGEQKPFTQQTIGLRKDDIVYTFTDGFADQFGGEKGKKFKYKNLQQLLLSNASKPMAEQKQILEKTLRDWQGNMEQVDDILIVGIRF